MRTKNVVAVLFGMFLLPAAVAHAEGPQPGEAGYVDPQYQQQPQQQQVIADPNAQQQGPVVEDQSSNQQAQEGRGIEYGAYLTVPIFVGGVMGDATNVGVGILGRIGWEFGSGFAAELNIGVQYNGATLVDLGTGSTFDGGVTNVWGGAGLRYSFLNPSALVPFVGLGLQLNFWGADDGSGSTTNDSMAVGFNALAGLAYEVSADLAIEAGLRWDISGKGSNNIPGEATSYLSPFVGATLYY
jgi:opacity protein-like surface antigen